MAIVNEVGTAKIKVIGVGGGGSNAVSRMMREQVPGVEFIAVNTDAQSLALCEAPLKIRIGDELTRGLGVGGDPDKGRRAAEESRAVLEESVQGADMVFIAAGMGGGTGTGAAPIVAECARQAGALTVAMVTRPFSFEGNRRRQNADAGIARLKEQVDTLIIISNDRLMDVCEEKVSWQNAFKMVDQVLQEGILAIAELVTVAGDVNLDFADVKAIMTNSGQALMAIGRASGENRAVEAARGAISNPLLDADISGAKGVLFNVTGGTDLTLGEVNAAAGMVRDLVDPEANIITGFVTDTRMEGQVKITIIATGFEEHQTTVVNSNVDDVLARVLEESELDVPPFMRRRGRNGFRAAHAT